MIVQRVYIHIIHIYVYILFRQSIKPGRGVSKHFVDIGYNTHPHDKLNIKTLVRTANKISHLLYDRPNQISPSVRGTM